MSNILKIAASGVEAAPTGYQIERSLRFNSADTAYLSRTPASAGNRKTWTWSGWVKRGNLVTSRMPFFGAGTSTPFFYMEFVADGSGGATGNELRISQYNGSSDDFNVTTDALYRDTSAWYHIVLAVDTTQATASDRVKIYVNGSQITVFHSNAYPSLNFDTEVNTAEPHNLGTATGIANYFDGYLTEINFVDGQALTPSDFGETDATTGVWKPKAYTGSYGTNGFYLNFSDNTSTTTLGEDQAGSNDWTLNNFSVAAGAGNDSLVDTPTPYGTDTGAGGEVRGNYCTLNPLSLTTGASLANGNLNLTTGTNPSGIAYGTIAIPSSGKWYWEYVGTSNGEYCFNGISDNAFSKKVIYFGVNGQKYVDAASGASYGATYTTNDVIGVAVNADSNEVTFYKNGSSQGAISYDLSVATFFAVFSDGASSFGTTQVVNFGQRPFSHAAPAGFKALCTQNLPEPTIADGGEYFNTVLYTGNGSTQSITGVGFQPDLVWVKGRSLVSDNRLHDAVRSAEQTLTANSTAAESVDSGLRLTSLDSDGFSVGSSTFYNNNTSTYVAWNWNAGGSNATNTDGTITSTVRANPTAGFSIVSYTGTGISNATVGHGLGATPAMIISKNRDLTYNWDIYHQSLGISATLIFTTAATRDFDAFGTNNPTSTVFSVQNGFTNTSGSDYIAYCFAEIEGYSKFGSYTGNGSADGPFVYCGFRPAFVLYKSTVTAGSWSIFDASRDIDNAVVNSLSPNLSDAETSSGRASDFLSNGFKWRNTIYGNTANEVYIFMAFAENPFKYSLAR